MLINKRLSNVCLLGSLLISTLPTFAQANEVCTDASLEQVSQFVSAHQYEWEGAINSLEFIDGQYPPPPEEELVFSSLSEAAEAMQSSSNKGSKMTFGTPFPTYTVSPENAFNNTTGQPDFISLLKFQEIWLVPAFLGDKPVSLLEVSCNNSLSIVGTGFKSLAEKLHTLNQKLVNLEVEQSWFVRLFSIKHIFLVVKQHGNYTIYPLYTFPSSYAGLKTIDELGGYNPIEVFSKIKEQWPIPEDCTVIYRSDGTLHIPCITTEGSSEPRYSAILEVIDQKALTFGVFELKDKPNDFGGN
ncbi:MAG: hypothetical protein KAI83_15210 [Thiomargarita sp.]|nr:hypothetical protein [Thiomargarita sp.]